MKRMFENVEPFNNSEGENVVNVIIDTPRGSRNKYKFDEKLGLFKLRHVLAAGLAFPFDFGFIPDTKGGDGDALDVIVLNDEALFSGCLVAARLIGIIEAEQTHAGKTSRNDRLIAVATKSRAFGKITDLDGVG